MKRIAVLLGVFCIVSVARANVLAPEPTGPHSAMMVDVDKLIEKAVKADDTTELKRILEKYDGPLKKQGLGNSLLYDVASEATKDQWDMIIKYVDDDGSFTDLSWNVRRTLLYASVSNPKAGLEITKFLVEEKKLDVNARDCGGATAIYMSSEGANDDDIVAYLLKCGADIEAKDNGSETPLIYACSWGKSSEQHAIHLIKHGADVFYESKDNSPLFAAAKSGQPKAITAILNAMVDRTPDDHLRSTREWVDRPLRNFAARDSGPQTALMVAMDADSQWVEHFKGDTIGAVKALIAAGADVNYVWPVVLTHRVGQHIGWAGETPIYWARNGKIASTLIAAGANVNVCDNRGITPLEAHTKGFQWFGSMASGECIGNYVRPSDKRNEVVEELLKNHANPFPSQDRRTPYQIALTSGDKELIEIYKKYHADVVNPYVSNNERPR